MFSTDKFSSALCRLLGSELTMPPFVQSSRRQTWIDRDWLFIYSMHHPVTNETVTEASQKTEEALRLAPSLAVSATSRLHVSVNNWFFYIYIFFKVHDSWHKSAKVLCVVSLHDVTYSKIGAATLECTSRPCADIQTAESVKTFGVHSNYAAVYHSLEEIKTYRTQSKPVSWTRTPKPFGHEAVALPLSYSRSHHGVDKKDCQLFRIKTSQVWS